MAWVEQSRRLRKRPKEQALSALRPLPLSAKLKPLRLETRLQMGVTVLSSTVPTSVFEKASREIPLVLPGRALITMLSPHPALRRATTQLLSQPNARPVSWIVAVRPSLPFPSSLGLPSKMRLQQGNRTP
jgi:hypothetical protein